MLNEIFSDTNDIIGNTILTTNADEELFIFKHTGNLSFFKYQTNQDWLKN